MRCLGHSCPRNGGGKRAGTLRGIPIARRLGLTSLVVSFRNDGDAPPSYDGRYNLGQGEWRDVEAGINYAIANGAERIVLFGWSLGAAIALQAAALSQSSSRIAGMVLDAPVFDWRTTLAANAKAAGLPRHSCTWLCHSSIQGPPVGDRPC